MNKIILMLGSILFLFFIFLTIFPPYEKFKKSAKHRKDIDREDFNSRAVTLAILLSLMTNFLFWGWFF